MISRQITAVLKRLAATMPVVSLTGPRQSGKSTLAKSAFRDFLYVNLEDLEKRAFAVEDPKGFLDEHRFPCIIDEAQYAPALFSAVQVLCDKEDRNGMFVLTGSQDFLLSKAIAQSLAGRVAQLHLLPFSMRELSTSSYRENKWENYVYKGFYPRVYDKKLDPSRWYSDYVKTYVERDLRDITHVGDLRSFHQFLMLCAGRVGQILNFSSLGNDIGVSYQTIGRWISVLESTNIVILLQPYYKNFNKRIIKSPKLYFNDPGLASFLLGIKSPLDLKSHYARGALFENLIIGEVAKWFYNSGSEPPIYFWRDGSGTEIDLLVEYRNRLHAIEIKSGRTFASDSLGAIKAFCKFSGSDLKDAALIYGGEERQSRDGTGILPWSQSSDLAESYQQ
jgi:predicted AAA+ superfamily ATPase